MDIIGITKTVAGLVASVSVGTVIGNAIKQSTPENAKIVQKVGIGIGAFVLSGITGDFAARYIENQIDDGLEAVNHFRHTKVIIVDETKDEKGSPENEE